MLAGGAIRYLGCEYTCTCQDGDLRFLEFSCKWGAKYAAYLCPREVWALFPLGTLSKPTITYPPHLCN